MVAPPLAALPLALVAVLNVQDPAIEIVTRTSAHIDARPWHRAVELTRAAGDSADPDVLLRAAWANLVVGRPARGRALLESHPMSTGAEPDAPFLAVSGELALALGEFTKAAMQFSAARAAGPPEARGRLAVREALAWETAAAPDEAAAAYQVARLALPAIDAWLRVRQAMVTPHVAHALDLLSQVSAAAAAAPAMTARMRIRLRGGDSVAALGEALIAADHLAAGRLALALRDSGLARSELYRALADQGSADAALPLLQAAAPPASVTEHHAVARALLRSGGAGKALPHARAVVTLGDSTPVSLALLGEALSAARLYAEAARAFGAAESRGGGPATALRRGEALLRIRAPNARAALLEVADRYPGTGEGASALLLLADAARDGGQAAEASRLLRLLVERFPETRTASSGRMRLARAALEAGDEAEAQRWFAREIAAGGSEQTAARYWRALLLASAGDTAAAGREWRGLAERDPIGYYGARARERAGLPPLRFTPGIDGPPGPVVEGFLQRLDLLREVGMGDEARAEVDWLMRRPPEDPLEALAYGEGLVARGFVADGIRLGWVASRQRGLSDVRVLRTVFPWPRRATIEAEAREFGVDPWLLAGLVRQESTFDTSATSPAGARGLTQLMPRTAAWLAERLAIPWDPRLIAVPDLNLHLGAAHLASLLRSYDGDMILALTAYNAGGGRVRRWIRSATADDPDRWIEQIPYAETRHYVRAVLRNLALYRALYGQ